MAIAGRGTFRTLKPTAHTITNAAIVQRFLDVAIELEHECDELYRISVGAKRVES